MNQPVFHILSVDRKNRSVTPYGKLPHIGSNTGNVFAVCPDMWSLESRPVTPQQPATFFLREYITYRSINVMSQLASGLKAIHEKGIVHSDINVENVLYCGGIVKNCDFGLAYFHDEQEP